MESMRSAAFRHIFPPRFARHLLPCLGDADRVCFANRSIPHWRRPAKILASVSACTGFTPAHLFSAGVQTMRARICSAFSCDMFARVVWLRLRGVAKPSIFDLSLAVHTCHALLPATNSCTREEIYKRGERSLI